MNTRARAREGREDFLDGEWHRLHPATPFLRGGVALIVAEGPTAVVPSASFTR